MRPRKSWTERLNDPRPHVVKPAPISIAGMKAGEIMLVPTALQVDAAIRVIPKGTAIDVPTLRRRLAAANGAEVTCPITIGYHLRTVAEAAWEAHARGVPDAKLTPVWRVLDATTPTTARLSCGPGFVLERREREGL